MTLGRAHKVTTYLMVGSAMVAMVGGGTVSALYAAIGLLGLGVSWWWEAPRINFARWQKWWTVGSVLVLIYALIAAIATAEYITIGAEFLIWLTLAKTFSRRTLRDYQQLHLISLLMLVAGSVLNIDLVYGVAFLVFVVSSTWTIILFQLRRETEENLLLRHSDTEHAVPVELERVLTSTRVISGRFLVGTGGVSLMIFVASAVFFLAVPRVGAGFFMKSRGGLSMAGFSDGVKLGGHGTIKNDNTIVMRVQVPAAYGGRTAEALHWRGVAFDQYKNGTWSRTASAPQTNYTSDQPALGRERRLVKMPGRDDGREDVEEVMARTVKQEIWLEPMETDVLFAASAPRVYDVSISTRVRGRVERNDEVRVDHGSTLHYTVWSQLEPPPPDALRAAVGPLPKGYDIFVALPDEITPATRELAEQITAGATTDFDRVVALETWLRTQLSYTLEQVSPGSREPLDFFLFERRAGHCEYFASAFVVMARSLGIPARNVAGFLGGEWNEYDNYIAVRAGDAHSWAEVFFPGEGWVTFDPTPGAQQSADRGSGGIRAKLRRMLDTLRFQWTRWVIDFDLSRQVGMFKSIGSGVRSVARTIRGGVTAAKAWVARHAEISIGLLLLLAAGLAYRYRRGFRSIGKTATKRKGTASPIALAYYRVRRVLAGQGIGNDPAITPRELANQRLAAGTVDAGSLAELTELFYAAEFGGRNDEPAAAKAAALGRDLAEQLRDLRRS